MPMSYSSHTSAEEVGIGMSAPSTAGVATVHNFINGRSVAAASGETAPVINPASEQEIARAPVSGAADVDAACRAAAEAFPAWRDTTPSERSLALFRVADALEARQDELLD